MSAERSARGYLFLLAAAYTAFVVYGSLVPLNFQPMSLAAALDAFDALRLDLGTGSRVDLATNVVLTIPLAFLWTGALWPARGAALRIAAIALVLAFCLLVSIAVEFTQIFFPGRRTSLNDVAAQVIGEVIGVVLWCTFGTKLTHWLTSLRLAQGRVQIAQQLLLVYIFVLVGYNILPLDLSVNPVELYRKWREGGVVILPFGWRYASRAQQIYELVSDVLIWIPVACLWRLSSRQPNAVVWLKVVGVAAGIEFLQLFVMSRVSDSTDVVLAAVGALIGIWAVRRFDRAQRSPSVAREDASFRMGKRLAPWILAVFGWLAVLALVFWYPFNFDFEPGFLRRRLSGLSQVPLEAYWRGSPFRAVTEVLHKTGFLFPLGVLLGGIVSRLSRRIPSGFAHVLAVVFICATAATIEVVQLALPGKNVDLTDWFFEASGGLAGYAVFLTIHRRLNRHRTHSRIKATSS